MISSKLKWLPYERWLAQAGRLPLVAVFLILCSLPLKLGLTFRGLLLRLGF